MPCPSVVEPEAERLGEPIIVARHRAEQHTPDDRGVNLLSVLSWIAVPTAGGA